MITDHRHVRTLALRCPDRAAVQRGQRLIEEALRLAALPGDGLPGRLFVRHLELGECVAELGVRALSERVTRVMRDAYASALAFDAPGAAGAAAVRAPPELDAWLLLARRAAAPAPLDLSAWFWPLIFPGLTAATDRRRALQLATEALLRIPAPFPAFSLLLERLVEDGNAGALLSALTPALARALLPTLGVDGSASVALAPAAPGEAAAPHVVPAPESFSWSAGWADVIEQFVASWGAADVRTLWLCATALWSKAPSLLAGPAAPLRIASLVQAAGAGALERPATRERTGASSQPAGSTAAQAGESSATEPSRPQPVPDGNAPPLAKVTDPGTQRDAPGRSLNQPVHETPCGGVFFLLHVLARLGLRSFLSSNLRLAEAAFLKRFLDHILEACGAPEHDVLRVWLAPPEPVPDGQGLQAPITAWRDACRRWLLEHTELELESLVCRPASVLLTATALNLVFDLEQSDVVVRRAALDLDPGYVPALGRVVKFHYLQHAREALRLGHHP